MQEEGLSSAMPWLSIFRLISAANAQMLFHY